MTPIHTVVQFHQDRAPSGHGQLYPSSHDKKLEATVLVAHMVAGSLKNINHDFSYSLGKLNLITNLSLNSEKLHFVLSLVFNTRITLYFILK